MNFSDFDPCTDSRRKRKIKTPPASADLESHSDDDSEWGKCKSFSFQDWIYFNIVEPNYHFITV